MKKMEITGTSKLSLHKVQTQAKSICNKYLTQTREWNYEAQYLPFLAKVLLKVTASNSC